MFVAEGEIEGEDVVRVCVFAMPTRRRDGEDSGREKRELRDWTVGVM
jgi:hypothetical protein